MAAFDPKVTKKTVTVPRGYHLYLLYEAHLWTDVVNQHLLPAGYGVVVPDLLGYSGTSKPTDKAEYAMDKMTADLVAILDAESIPKVVSLGHDWGSPIAQRFYNFYPSRTAGLVTMNVAYLPPMQEGEPFDLDAGLELTQKILGYGTYHYWKFFTADDGAQVLKSHPESVYDVCHGDPETLLDTFCKPGGFRDFVTNGKTQPVLKYAQGKRRDEFVKRMSRDGFDAPQCWYKSYVFGVAYEADQKVPKENLVVNVPYLFWGAKNNKVCRPEAIQAPKDGGLLPHSTEIVRDGGHWAYLAEPEVFGKDLTGWLNQTFDGK